MTSHIYSSLSSLLLVSFLIREFFLCFFHFFSIFFFLRGVGEFFFFVVYILGGGLNTTNGKKRTNERDLTSESINLNRQNEPSRVPYRKKKNLIFIAFFSLLNYHYILIGLLSQTFSSLYLLYLLYFHLCQNHH